jgi:transposase
MRENVIFVGIDVDDKAFHVAALQPETGPIENYRVRPTSGALIKKLSEIEKNTGKSVHCCYEASYIGFPLQRQLGKAGVKCEVIAPNSIPRIKGNQIKTDRVDAEKLAQFYANGQLTAVVVPDEEQEQDRDFMRSRQQTLHRLAEIRTQIQALLRRHDMNFKSETGFKTHWTKVHKEWLQRLANKQENSFHYSLSILLFQMSSIEQAMDRFNTHVEVLADKKRYQKQVRALTCFRGIKNIFALVIVTEIGDIKRFKNPRSLVSYMGMDIREHSSGGKHNRFGITKHGNRHLRTAFIEANQKSALNKVISDDLRRRREDIDIKYVEIADRCMTRLYKKGSRLLRAGKHTNKVKVACAREMVGFIWESLSEAA